MIMPEKVTEKTASIPSQNTAVATESPPQVLGG